MSKLYPLKFDPIYKEKIWGGQKIKTVLGKNLDELENCGETWELSGVSGNVSKVSNGPLKGRLLTELIEEFGASLLGERILDRFGKQFPLLVKFIDAAQDLSIQVHPNDELAAKRHGSSGKTEMWYILQADKGASLVSGFNRELTQEDYLAYFDSDRLDELLNYENAQAGDVFFLPAGRIHTIGAGLLLAEIQQSADITYRIYDFDRVDKNGFKRELHTKQALEAIDFKHYKSYKTSYVEKPDTPCELVSSPYFTTNKLSVTKPLKLNRDGLDCFKAYIGIGGKGMIDDTEIKLGEVLLVPASQKRPNIYPEGKLEILETYIEL